MCCQEGPTTGTLHKSWTSHWHCTLPDRTLPPERCDKVPLANYVPTKVKQTSLTVGSLSCSSHGHHGSATNPDSTVSHSHQSHQPPQGFSSRRSTSSQVSRRYCTLCCSLLSIPWRTTVLCLPQTCGWNPNGSLSKEPPSSSWTPNLSSSRSQEKGSTFGFRVVRSLGRNDKLVDSSVKLCGFESGVSVRYTLWAAEAFACKNHSNNGENNTNKRIE